ncbi:MAG: anti-sigma factor [Devosia sp.]|nr:anti-sigma factor [Devosia sp.]
MLTCREITELANGYLDRELPLLTRAQFRLHIIMCSHCRRYVDQLAKTVNMLKTLPHGTPPPDVEEKLVRLLERKGATELPE